MHRARITIYPLPALIPGQYDFYMPRIRFVSLPRTCLSIEGPFEELVAPLRESAARNAANFPDVPKNQVLFPVHELQIPSIRFNFPDVHILPEEFAVIAPAQASIRLVHYAVKCSNY